MRQPEDFTGGPNLPENATSEGMPYLLAQVPLAEELFRRDRPEEAQALDGHSLREAALMYWGDQTDYAARYRAEVLAREEERNRAMAEGGAPKRPLGWPTLADLGGPAQRAA